MSQDQFDDSTLENMLSTLSGALTISRKTTLSNGVSDAVVIASTAEANRLFGYESLKGKLIPEIHKADHAMRTRVYAWARYLGEEAPTSYPMCIQTADGQHLWVQKEVEQRNINGSILWITKNTLLPQDRDYQMPMPQHQDELLHEFLRLLLLEPSHIASPHQADKMEIVNVSYYSELLKRMQAQTAVESLTCVRCGHQWRPYVQAPKKCPKCRQTWYKEKAWVRKKR